MDLLRRGGQRGRYGGSRAAGEEEGGGMGSLNFDALFILTYLISKRIMHVNGSHPTKTTTLRTNNSTTN
jgi:hypothetical protein